MSAVTDTAATLIGTMVLVITVLQTTRGAQDHAPVSLDVVRSKVIDALACIRKSKFDRRARCAII